MADPGFANGKGKVESRRRRVAERRRRKYLSAEGAEGSGLGRGCPLPNGEGSEEGGYI